MQQKKQQGVDGKPLQSHLGDRRRVFVFDIALSRSDSYDIRPHKRQKDSRRSIESGRAVEDVDSYADKETIDQELPFRGVEWQKQHKQHVDIRVNVGSEAEVVEHQHLHREQHEKP